MSLQFARYSRAIVREIADSLPQYALRSEVGSEISLSLARKQHERYIAALQKAGLHVTVLPADNSTPDCVFVEDTSIICGNKALLTRLGHPSRRPEVDVMRRCLKETMRISVAETPEDATIDGGDVLFTGAEFFVGITKRTNYRGLETLAAVFEQFPVFPIEGLTCLHLKSVASMGSDKVVIVGKSDLGQHVKAEMRRKSTKRLQFLDVPDDSGANCVIANDSLLYVSAEQFPESAGIIEDAFKKEKRHLIPLENTELSKVDGCLTCCSLLLA